MVRQNLCTRSASGSWVLVDIPATIQCDILFLNTSLIWQSRVLFKLPIGVQMYIYGIIYTSFGSAIAVLSMVLTL